MLRRSGGLSTALKSSLGSNSHVVYGVVEQIKNSLARFNGLTLLEGH
jgi:hypothetical protein